MKEKPTDELNELLENMRPKQLKKYFADNSDQMISGDRPFYYYMKSILHEKRIKLGDMYSFAGFKESYGGQIVRMEKPTRNRDHIIRLCIAGRFSLIETNRALKLYGMNELYSKDVRDACLIVSIKNRIYDLAQIDDILIDNGFEKLSLDVEE